MEQRTLKIVKSGQNTNIYSYLETSGGQSYNLYENVNFFSTPVLIRYLWKLRTVDFMHWCLICNVLLNSKQAEEHQNITEAQQRGKQTSLLPQCLVQAGTNLSNHLPQISKEINCSSFVVYPLLVPHLPMAFLASFFLSFLLLPLTVLMRQTRQVVCAINQPIFLRCLWHGQT